MISNTWGKLDLYCGAGHTEKMELKQKRAGIFYECPLCKNSFSMNDIEKFLDKLENIQIEAELNDELLDIKNIKLKVGMCRYQILENNDRIKVMGINEKAVNYGKKS